MFKVLVNAYACNPNWGSEQGIGWHWSIELAKYCRVIVITEGEFKDNIEKALAALPQKDNVTFVYNNVSEKVRRMCWNQGDWRFYYYYRQWQVKTLEIAKAICDKEKIDVIHQLNMQGFREPGLLWRIKGPKFVWGPVGGMGIMPLQYLKGESLKKRVFFGLKNIINKLQYHYQPNVRKAIRRADVLLASTPDEQRVFKDIYQRDSFFVNDTGCDVTNYEHIWDKEKESLDMIWVAKFDFRKQLGLAIRVMALLKDLQINLNIVGSGANITDYQHLADELGVSDKCHFHGVVPHDEVMKMMQSSDVFFFTSIMEATSTVILEAIGTKLPIVCFDTCGFGPIVNDSIGRKIKISNPEQSIKVFAETIRELYDQRDALRIMSENCSKVQRELSWEYKAQFVVNLYNKMLNN